MKALLFKLSSQIATQYYLQFKEHCVCISPPQEMQEKPALTWVDEFNEKAKDRVAQVMPLDFYDENEVTREDRGVVTLSEDHRFVQPADPLVFYLADIQSADDYHKKFGVTVMPYE